MKSTTYVQQVSNLRSHGVFAVRRVDKLAPPNRPQTVQPHQGAYAMAAPSQTSLGHSCAQPAATVGFVAGYKGRFEMNAGRTNG